MEFHHLRSFVVVADTGNLTQAAKRLCTTPPAISAHIKSLEEELKTPLFERSSKGMLLTAKGKLLLGQAQKTLDSAISMVNLATENQDELIGEFKLGINQSIQSLKINEIAQGLKENCPGISLSLEASSSGKILTAIENNVLDGGYVYGKIPNTFEGIALTVIPITTIAPLGFDDNSIEIASDLAQQPWITMTGYCPFDEELTDKLPAIDQSNISSSDDGSRLALVKSSLGLSFLEQDIALEAEKKGEITVLPQLDFSMPLHFVINKARSNEPVIKALMQEVRIAWNIAL